MLQIDDVVRVNKDAWTKLGSSGEKPEGPVCWISPNGVHRVMVKGSGWQFKQEDVELLWVDVDVSEFE